MNKDNIREKWTDNCRGLWDNWYMFQQHEIPDESSNYINAEYEKTPKVLKIFCALLFLLTIRFVVFQIINNYFANTISFSIFPNILTGIALTVAMIFLLDKKPKMGVYFFIFILLVSTIVFCFFSLFFDYLQNMICGGIYDGIAFLYDKKWIYWFARCIVSVIFFIICKIKNDDLKKITQDVYSSFEIKTQRYVYSAIFITPVLCLFAVLINLTGNEVLTVLYFIISFVISIWLLLRVLWGVGMSYRIAEFNGIIVFVFTFVSMYELLCCMNCI